MKLSVRVGQGGEVEEFDSLSEGVDFLNRLGVGKPMKWLLGGFETKNHWGDDYVLFVWTEGDEAVQVMTTAERMFVEESLMDSDL